MADQDSLWLSIDQEAYLDAWSTVYVEADIQFKLGIPLSLFIRAPGRYLFFAWLASPSSPAPLGWDSLPPAKDKKHLH
ncbi:MAG: hypothetical protein A2Y50_08480 [Pseudomonadales bacterium RIFCSPLOWO2_12_59_9]|nr:MAG: hypothetical protein A2Y50_08480 [Pseudomonadales bacterium RIFCSPLOWO2_12_59_9]